MSWDQPYRGRQPVGVPAWPAGMLLLADLPGAQAVADVLVSGQDLTDPAGEWAFLTLAEPDPAGAAALLPVGPLVADYDRAVLVGSPQDWADLAARVAGPDADPTVAALVAVARYSLDLAGPPEVATTGLPGEVVAVVRSAGASAALERGDLRAALAELDAAVAAAHAAGSPLLGAALCGTRSDLLREAGDAEAAAAEASAGLALLPGTAPPERHAELLLARALARRDAAQLDGRAPDRGAMLGVVSDLQAALQTFREDRHPDQFAAGNVQLALAYLVMPMTDAGDRIRVGVAVNALRAALRVYRPDTHPAEWANAQLNLATALQHLPSARAGDHLAEAVDLYEELLAHRDPARDPLGCARLLANQGNALAHLGLTEHARGKLAEAARLFAEAGEPASAAAVEELLAEVATAQRTGA